MAYISDILTDPSVFEYGQFNLINAPCGAGKSHMIANCLLSLFPDVRPCEVLYLTSRTITVTQQVATYNALRPYDLETDFDPIFWRGDPSNVPEDKICIMTYDKAIYAITSCASIGSLPFDTIKIIVVDECHALVTDTFIDSVTTLILLLRYELRQRSKLIIGMTATPQILFNTPEFHGFPIHTLCMDMEPRYKAKQLILTAWQNLPTLLCDPEYNQKTLVMVQTRTQAIELQKQIPNSAILISRNNDDWYEEGMLPIWLELIQNKKMPDKCLLPVFNTEHTLIRSEMGDLRVLIVTSVAREGLNIIEESCIRNVVCCIPDDLHITQFLGRCRYNVDNLILSHSPRDPDKNTFEYLLCQRDLFASFLNGTDARFFRYIKHLLQHDAAHTIRYTNNRNLRLFHQYLEEHWILTDPEAKVPAEKLIQKAQHSEIAAYASKLQIFDFIEPRPRTKNFNALLPLIREQFSCEYRAARPFIDGKQHKGHVLVTVSESA